MCLHSIGGVNAVGNISKPGALDKSAQDRFVFNPDIVLRLYNKGKMLPHISTLDANLI